MMDAACGLRRVSSPAATLPCGRLIDEYRVMTARVP